MKGKISRIVLGCYDLFLASGAIYYGSKMVLGIWWNGEWPDVWINKVPFTSWFWPGVIAIVVYGLGNLVAAYFSFSNKEKGWKASGIMGLFFLFSLLASFIVLGEGYLATFQFIILSIIQLILTIIAVVTLKNKIIIGTVLAVLLSVFVVGYIIDTIEPYNLVILNDSGEDLSSIGYNEEYISRVFTNGIKSKGKFKLYIENNRFSLNITEINGKEHVSQQFNIDLLNNLDNVYEISIQKNSSGEYKFILIE